MLKHKIEKKPAGCAVERTSAVSFWLLPGSCWSRVKVCSAWDKVFVIKSVFPHIDPYRIIGCAKVACSRDNWSWWGGGWCQDTHLKRHLEIKLGAGWGEREHIPTDFDTAPASKTVSDSESVLKTLNQNTLKHLTLKKKWKRGEELCTKVSRQGHSKDN